MSARISRTIIWENGDATSAMQPDARALGPVPAGVGFTQSRREAASAASRRGRFPIRVGAWRAREQGHEPIDTTLLGLDKVRVEGARPLRPRFRSSGLEVLDLVEHADDAPYESRPASRCCWVIGPSNVTSPVV